MILGLYRVHRVRDNSQATRIRDRNLGLGPLGSTVYFTLTKISPTPLLGNVKYRPLAKEFILPQGLVESVNRLPAGSGFSHLK